MKKTKFNNTTRSFIIPSIIIISMVLILGVLYAVVSTSKSTILYDSYRINDLRIYLPKLAGLEFVENQNDFSMIGNDMMVSVLVDEKTVFTDNDVEIPNLFNYTATIVTNNNADVSSIETNNDYYTFELKDIQNEQEYHYYCATYQSQQDFYLVTFTCFEENDKVLRNKIYHYFELVEIIKNND